jgi:hypothetical protein
MSNEIMTQAQSTELTVSSAMEELGISIGDLSIPKIHCMQSTSDMVGEGLAKPGQFVNSMTKEVIGEYDKPVEIIPLFANKTWVYYDMTSGQPKFMRIEAMTPQNEHLPWDDVENGVKIRRDAALNFFVLRATEAEDDECFPYVISFKRTSYQAGKALATHLLKLKMFRKPVFSKSVILSSRKEKKDTNTYAVMGIAIGKPTSDKAQAAAQLWLEMLQKGAYKVDDSDVKDDAKAAAPKMTVVGAEKSDLY